MLMLPWLTSLLPWRNTFEQQSYSRWNISRTNKLHLTCSLKLTTMINSHPTIMTLFADPLCWPVSVGLTGLSPGRDCWLQSHQRVLKACTAHGHTQILCKKSAFKAVWWLDVTILTLQRGYTDMDFIVGLVSTITEKSFNQSEQFYWKQIQAHDAQMICMTISLLLMKDEVHPNDLIQQIWWRIIRLINK